MLRWPSGASTLSAASTTLPATGLASLSAILCSAFPGSSSSSTPGGRSMTDCKGANGSVLSESGHFSDLVMELLNKALILRWIQVIKLVKSLATFMNPTLTKIWEVRAIGGGFTPCIAHCLWAPLSRKKGSIKKGSRLIFQAYHDIHITCCLTFLCIHVLPEIAAISPWLVT
ncbi:hypothetical protein COCNU_scaffold002990G000040 [Cocos nucifera]|nr:hypothetical protein [Cocos nucifera]